MISKKHLNPWWVVRLILSRLFFSGVIFFIIAISVLWMNSALDAVRECISHDVCWPLWLLCGPPIALSVLLFELIMKSLELRGRDKYIDKLNEDKE